MGGVPLEVDGRLAVVLQPLQLSLLAQERESCYIDDVESYAQGVQRGLEMKNLRDIHDNTAFRDDYS